MPTPAATISPLHALRSSAVAPQSDTPSSVSGPIDPLHDPAWDAAFNGSGTATYFNTVAWVRVLHDTYGYKAAYFVDRLGNGTQFFPIMEVSTPIRGRRGISLPFTDECAAFRGDENGVCTLFQSALDYGRSRRWNYLGIHGGAAPAANAKPAVSFYGHMLDLRPGEPRLFQSLDSSVRRAIRKAENASVKVEISESLDSVRSYYKLHCLTRRRHGLPPQPWQFFANLQRHLIASGHGFVTLASVRSMPVAGAIFLHAQKEAMYKFGASNDAFQSLRPNNLVMWEAIKHCARKGFEILRFGRTSIENQGLRRYKCSWGTNEYDVHYWRYSLRQEQFVTESDSAHGLHNHLFRLMPIPLSRLLGAILYKHIA